MTAIQHNKPTAAAAAEEHLAGGEAEVTPVAENFYTQVMQLRAVFPPEDDTGIGEPGIPTPANWRISKAW